jgi:hypothetical protein
VRSQRGKNWLHLFGRWFRVDRLRGLTIQFLLFVNPPFDRIHQIGSKGGRRNDAMESSHLQGSLNRVDVIELGGYFA